MVELRRLSCFIPFPAAHASFMVSFFFSRQVYTLGCQLPHVATVSLCSFSSFSCIQHSFQLFRTTNCSFLRAGGRTVRAHCSVCRRRSGSRYDCGAIPWLLRTAVPRAKSYRRTTWCCRCELGALISLNGVPYKSNNERFVFRTVQPASADVHCTQKIVQS